MLTPLVDFLIAILVTSGVGFFAIRLAKKFHLMDQPHISPHKKHAKATPLAGGIAIILSLFIMILISHDWVGRKFPGLFIAAIIIFVFGLWDDAVRLPSWIKLVGQMLAGFVLVFSGISVHIFSIPGWEWLNYLITLFWVVGVINGCNFIDSYDRLSIGVVITILISLMIGTSVSGQQDLFQFIIILLGILVILYFFNTTPAMLFLGDSGSQLLGLFVASLSIMFVPKNFSHTISWFAPILIAGIPIFDTTLVVFSRIRRRKHIYQAGLDHTWHRLISMGLAENKAVEVLHLASIILGSLALLTLVVPPAISKLIIIGILLAGFGLILYLDKEEILGHE